MRWILVLVLVLFPTQEEIDSGKLLKVHVLGAEFGQPKVEYYRRVPVVTQEDSQEDSQEDLPSLPSWRVKRPRPLASTQMSVEAMQEMQEMLAGLRKPLKRRKTHVGAPGKGNGPYGTPTKA